MSHLPLTQIQENQFSKWFEQKSNGKNLMELLFDRLDGAYPHKWRSNFPNQDAIDNWMTSWSEAFEEEKVTPEMIKNGLKACRSQFDWPPSCAEFIKSCKPAVKEAAHVFMLPPPKDNFSREDAAKRLAEIGAAEIIKPKTDHKLWAKRIIEKSKQPKHGLSFLQISFAKEALAVK